MKFVRKSSTCKTIDQLRDFLYHHANCQYLPPTCYATRLHILRAFYATNLMTYVLSRTSKSLNPTLYGSEVVNDLLVLQFENDLIPEEVTITCNYSKCATQAPPCRQRHLPCCFFCKCRSNVYSTDSEWRNRLG